MEASTAQLSEAVAEAMEAMRDCMRTLAQMTDALLSQVETLTGQPDDPTYDTVREALRVAGRVDSQVDDVLRGLRA